MIDILVIVFSISRCGKELGDCPKIYGAQLVELVYAR